MMTSDEARAFKLLFEVSRRMPAERFKEFWIALYDCHFFEEDPTAAEWDLICGKMDAAFVDGKQV